MGVLEKCLLAYGVGWQPSVRYACTCAMGRAAYPGLPDHKLSTLCAHLGIELNHHHAGSDSRAAALLLLDYMQHGTDVKRHIRRYGFSSGSTQRMINKPKPNESTRQLAVLKDLLNDITADGSLSETEVLRLVKWISENDSLRGNYPFDRVFSVLQKTLGDGVLESDERQEMLALFEEVMDPVANACDCSAFNILGKTFCLTGEFTLGSRTEVQAKLAAMGGIPVQSVTGKTEYLIVGSQGSEVWSAGNYGNKVKKAIELQDKGSCIQILKEEDIAAFLA